MKPEHKDSRALGHLEKRCPVRASIDVIGGRWKPSILQLLHATPRRYGEIGDSIAGISAQALSLQLRQLVADGVIEKCDGTPATYRLTRRGAELADVMDRLATWGEDYLRWRGVG